ncbi:integrase core domain-containing protein [Isoptericola aurantiacus]|uniref:integrase core domain-containing protein n=1 Tax=Isoptericola aurantiacus TaxID=3377839 RepID=UPI00383AA3E0
MPEPRKRPRAAMRRFVYPAPNCMWQIDAFDWTLADGSAAVVFQVIDDHSRLALASLAARGETSHGAIEVVATAMDRWGVPQRFLSDNGGAFNPTRRGHTGRLVEFLTARGTEPVTGRPGRPTTQGKNERIHQTMLRYLRAQPAAETIGELQVQIETFDAYYNHERGHQSLPGPNGLMTPAEAWQATAPAEPPQPPAGHETSQTLPAAPPRPRPAPKPQGYLPPETHTAVGAAGRATAHGTEFHVGTQHAAHTVTITFTTTTVLIVAAHTGELLRRYTRPAPGTRYAGPRTHPDPDNEP